jgi:hypothetical protein
MFHVEQATAHPRLKIRLQRAMARPAYPETGLFLVALKKGDPRKRRAFHAKQANFLPLQHVSRI